MKKQILLVIIILFIKIPAFSQKEHTLIQLSFDYIYYPFIFYPGNHSDFSYKSGGNIAYFINNRVAVSTGLEYETKKFTIDYESTMLYNKETFDLRYINFPLKMEIEIFDKRSNALYLKTGFEHGSLIYKERLIEYQNGNTVSSLSDYHINKFIINVAFGFAYRLFIAESYFIGACPNIRYNVTNSQGIYGYSGQGTALSFMLQVHLGYRF